MGGDERSDEGSGIMCAVKPAGLTCEPLSGWTLGEVAMRWPQKGHELDIKMRDGPLTVRGKGTMPEPLPPSALGRMERAEGRLWEHSWEHLSGVKGS